MMMGQNVMMGQNMMMGQNNMMMGGPGFNGNVMNQMMGMGGMGMGGGGGLNSGNMNMMGQGTVGNQNPYERLPINSRRLQGKRPRPSDYLEVASGDDGPPSKFVRSDF